MGCGEEAARSPCEGRAGQEWLEVQFELSELLRWLGVMRTRWRCWSVRQVVQRHALQCWKWHGAQRDAPGGGAQPERQSSSVWLLLWASTVHARWIGWLILSLLWLVFDFSSWITPDLLILCLREQQLALGRDQDCAAGRGEGEAAAKRASATRVC